MTGARSATTEEVYEKVFHRNAEAFFPERRTKVTTAMAEYRSLGWKTSQDRGEASM